MVSLDFEKPSTWSIGKKLGLLAVLFLIIGPFLPYFVEDFEYEGTTNSGSISYFDYDFWGLFILLPLFSAILIATLLYLKFNLFVEKGTTRINIKPFILMIWGFWFFLTYAVEASRFTDSWDSGYGKYARYPGVGLWLIIIGFLLCAVVGFLEWRLPSASGPGVPKVRLPKREPKPTAEVTAEPSSEVVAPVEPERPVSVVVKEDVGPKEVVTELKPTPTVSEKVEMLTREPSSEEEKALLRWARHINEDGQTFEQCIKCQNYVFITTKSTKDTIVFECPDCGEKFTLKK
ncbi:MAG: hypothetical protein JSW00_02110 [Thermoplasmata archaeon]|nr:MAG: hypothetical protein JSW00_02110 [Thermoplasmata archaeon]